MHIYLFIMRSTTNHMTTKLQLPALQLHSLQARTQRTKTLSNITLKIRDFVFHGNVCIIQYIMPTGK